MDTFIKFLAVYFTALAAAKIFIITISKYPRYQKVIPIADGGAAIEYGVLATIAWILTNRS